MTYLELYRSLASVDEIKKKAFDDTKVALFLGGNPDRIRAIEDAMNEAIREMEVNRMNDLISRQAAIDAIEKCHKQCCREDATATEIATDINVGDKDIISRKAAIEEIERWLGYIDDDMVRRMQIGMKRLPPAQPERTCVNCGRAANNGGWYADGGTRCPIEEHYALPKDGYCHLWEKRNVTDDDYTERREE